MKQSNSIRWLILLSFCLMLMTVLTPVMAAARPTLSLIPVWTPGEQLTTIDVNGNGTPEAGDDFRYVDLQLFLKGNVQFWAVNLECTMGRGIEFVSTAPTLTWGPEWGTLNTQYYEVNTFYDPTRGTLSMAATRVGSLTQPLGKSGVDYSMLLLSVRAQIANDTAFVRDTTAAFNCRIAEFLDRDGNPAGGVRRANVERTTPLSILRGYTITGSAFRQGSRTHNNIIVECEHVASNTVYTAATDTRGNFTFGGPRNLNVPGGAPLRDFGQYECRFIASSLSDPLIPQPAFLEGVTYINLTSPEYTLLPVTVKPGDFEMVTSENSITAMDDLAIVTGNWNGTVGTSFTGGDANGDMKVNQLDLAIVSGNVGLGDTPSALFVDHIVYGVGRDYDDTYPNSKIWWGDTIAGPVNEVIRASRTRDFWPQVSPNGEEVVYTAVTLDRRTNQYIHELYIGDVVRARGARFTPTRDFNWQAFAPSWSPDGKRIAFICSWNGQNDGYMYNQGHLCVMNRDDRTGTSLIIVDQNVKLFPPAWYDNTTLVYAGYERPDSDKWDNDVCPDALCYYDFTTNVTGQIALGAQSGTDIPDMPVIIQYADGTNYLFYRFYDSGGPAYNLRAGTIDYSGGAWSGGATGGLGATHVNVANTGGIDYYDASPLLDVIFYEFDSNAFQNLYKQSAGDLSGGWSAVETHFVDGYVGSPTYSDFLLGDTWNGDVTIDTPLHAYRATFDWIP